LRQAYDYWQDQPGSFGLGCEDASPRTKTSTNVPPGGNTPEPRSLHFFRTVYPRFRPANRTITPPEQLPVRTTSTSASRDVRWVPHVGGDESITRCRPSLYGCRRYGTVRASIEVTPVRRVVSGPKHFWTAVLETAWGELAAGQPLCRRSPFRAESLATDERSYTPARISAVRDLAHPIVARKSHVRCTSTSGLGTLSTPGQADFQAPMLPTCTKNDTVFMLLS